MLIAGRVPATRGEKTLFITVRTRKSLGEVRQRFEELFRRLDSMERPPRLAG